MRKYFSFFFNIKFLKLFIEKTNLFYFNKIYDFLLHRLYRFVITNNLD